MAYSSELAEARVTDYRLLEEQESQFGLEEEAFQWSRAVLESEVQQFRTVRAEFEAERDAWASLPEELRRAAASRPGAGR